MDERERNYINIPGTILEKRAKSELFRRYMEKRDIKEDISVDDEDYCKKMGVQVDDGESASDKARQDVVSKVNKLLDMATYVGAEQLKKRGKLPNKFEEVSKKLDSTIQGVPTQVLIEIIVRIKKDLRYVDPVTLDDHHSPIYLDEDMPITHQSDPAVERISAGLHYAAGRESGEDEGR